MPENLICPFMSCRLIDKDNTPTVAKCQEGNCALWDHDDNVCVFVGLKMEAIRHAEKN